MWCHIHQKLGCDGCAGENFAGTAAETAKYAYAGQLILGTVDMG
jgi:hypothetical protein